MSTVILLAVYNGEKHLPEQLASLSAQTDGDFSVLYQDDGSSDGTPALMKAYMRNDRRFIPASESGMHFGAAGNFLSLIRQSDADLVLLCDQDDIWEAEKLAVLKQAMLRAEKEFGSDTPILIHSDASVINEDGSPLLPSFFRHQGWDAHAVTLPRLLVQNNVTGCTVMMNRPLRDLIAGYGRAKEMFMHDWFIALTAASFGRIVFVSRPLVRYRQHGTNTIGASRKTLPERALEALGKRDRSRRRILLTYTHAKVFRRIYGDKLPKQAADTVDRYLATQKKRKLLRILSVRRLGCTMQSPITRLGQLFFG